MGFSLDIEDLRICLNEVDEVSDQISKGKSHKRSEGGGGEKMFLSGPFFATFPFILFD